MTWTEHFIAHLERRGITDRKAAEELKKSPSTILYWRRGSVPREETRKHVQRWSKGAVPASAGARAA